MISNLDAIIELAEILGIIGYSEFTSAFPFSLIFVELTLISEITTLDRVKSS